MYFLDLISDLKIMLEYLIMIVIIAFDTKKKVRKLLWFSINENLREFLQNKILGAILLMIYLNDFHKNNDNNFQT